MIAVYDKVNPKRLLGYINKEVELCGRSYSFCTRYLGEIICYWHPKWDDDHKAQHMVFTTKSSLADLLDCRHFSLPNETPKSFSDRWYLR